MKDKIQAWKDSTWQIKPTLDMPALDPQAVQFAVLDSDPIEDYRQSLKQNGERFRRSGSSSRAISERKNRITRENDGDQFQ